ncbi:hypothetical protein BCR43DRAFT_489074 [Syncephalastrum racemosum]|uniref:Uncharacterized protein n=1 Tax=Syncephalastrum racemosum TaxID=13706 RepID=A0A1X2HJQ5_SYNRA|nr:hypothetical protein BCR43DRAFT_489074 [Syncephalastrum racemosum]
MSLLYCKAYFCAHFTRIACGMRPPDLCTSSAFANLDDTDNMSKDYLRVILWNLKLHGWRWHIKQLEVAYYVNGCEMEVAYSILGGGMGFETPWLEVAYKATGGGILCEWL